MAANTLKYITIQGVPMGFDLRFPFHPSSAGSDWHVLHGTITLEDGSGLYAEVAVQMSAAVRETVPSLDADATLAFALNAIRKTVDTRDIEFLKSSKKQPVALNSRVFSVVTRQWRFHTATDEQIAEFLKAKVYWLTKLGQAHVAINDPIDQLYLGADAAKLPAIAQKLAQAGWLTLEAENAAATATLNAQGPQIEAQTRQVLDDLNAKHQFERETQKV